MTNLLIIPDMELLSPKDKIAELNNIRQITLTGAAGLIAAGTITLGFRTYLTNKRTQVSDRYGKAIAMIASDKLDERLGGIYALEHIMRESPSDHEVIVAVLMAFIREHSPGRLRPVSPDVRKEQGYAFSGGYDAGPTKSKYSPSSLTVDTDIQTAIDVIGRRPRRTERLKLNFSDCTLPNASFERARIDRAIFRNCVLDGAHFRDASMREVFIDECRGEAIAFRGANLKDAAITDSILTGSSFPGAHISGITFIHSDLSDSIFAHSIANQVYFGHTIMRNADLPTDWSHCRITDSEISAEMAMHVAQHQYEVTRTMVIAESDEINQIPEVRVRFEEFRSLLFGDK